MKQWVADIIRQRKVAAIPVMTHPGIELNGHTLYVNGVEYTQGTTSSGEAIEIISESSGRSGSPDGMPGDPPSGSPDGKPGDPPSGERPEGDHPKGGPDKK